jgi:cytoskeleton protein RodZ
MDEVAKTENVLFPERVGDTLREARTKAGLDLSDVASKTRIPLRLLTSIEAGDYEALPSITYSVGFVKSYARLVGLDEHQVAQSLRDELGHSTVLERTQPVGLDDEEPGPVPSSKLAWIAALIALLLAVGYGVLRSMQSDVPDAPATEQAASDTAEGDASANVAAPAAPNPQGTVTLTAKDAVWLRIYDAADKVLFEKEMAKGEVFTVPAANDPMIRTGRPDLLTVMLDGKEMPPLGPPERTIKDVGVSAAALAARAAVAADGNAANAVTTGPAPSASTATTGNPQ